MKRVIFKVSTLVGLVLGTSTLGGCATSAARPPETLSAVRAICPSTVVTDAGGLRAVAGCRAIAGNLTIEKSDLESLAGLEQLEAINGTLLIAGNRELSDLRGSLNLRSVGELVIRDNPALEDLRGLEGLRELDGLTLSRNGLYRTTGLEGLVRVRDVRVTDNPRLISLSGLDQLRYADSLEISGNPRIAAQLGRLGGLERVTGRLVLRKNVGLSAREVAQIVERARRPVRIASR
jgi:hypothetical protein